ncbi:LrgB family protein [Peptoniphilus sp. KCTC 25270]|uniref:LrgB family protein n=1 Tax=Peptoniphilus sp. KCTC 25270 TaxID=2897414 RepID=UPI001E58638F|nr:LrgB family protein [Peptoniphilus sp. KCTC 25270]MCD1147721.1 LrgB family protein [Peptoniphilus sp. KCTC 25270]
MNEIITTWLNSPIFGVLLTIAMFFLSTKIAKRINNPLLPNLLIAVILVVCFLVFTGISVETYQLGGDWITFLLGPLTIALAVPLYRQLDVLKKHFIPILVGIIVGAFVATISGIGLGILLDLDPKIIASIAPKSTTAAIAMDITNTYKGSVALTLALVTLAGIFGYATGPSILKFFKITDETAKGVALGTASHAMGTMRAFESSEEEGAMGSLSIALAGIVTTFVLPIVFALFSM